MGESLRFGQSVMPVDFDELFCKTSISVVLNEGLADRKIKKKFNNITVSTIAILNAVIITSQYPLKKHQFCTNRDRRWCDYNVYLSYYRIRFRPAITV